MIDEPSPPSDPGVDTLTPPGDLPPRPASPASSAAAITNNALRRWDPKNPQGRRTRDLYRSLMRMVGNPPEPARQALCISAAELMVLAEIARETSLKEVTSKNAEMAFKAEKAMRHALSALGVDKPVTADASDQGYGLFVDDEDEAP